MVGARNFALNKFKLVPELDQIMLHLCLNFKNI